MNYTQARESSIVIHNHIKEELIPLNNDYKNLILGGFSAGNVTNFYVLFEQIQD